LVSVIVGIHIFVAFCLIVAILLHQGRGYGLSSTFGGGLPSTFAGSSLIERNLDRITIAFAVIFFITSVLLVIIFRI